MAEIVRALDANHDWLFGQGLLDYKSNINAVSQDIDCNLQMFLGDCFFAVNNGIDWFNLLGGKNQLAISLAINAALLNTVGVTGILQTSFSISENRVLTVVYNVQTTYSTLQNTFAYDFGTSGT
jgi:hypothetical protein